MVKRVNKTIGDNQISVLFRGVEFMAVNLSEGETFASQTYKYKGKTMRIIIEATHDKKSN